MVQKVADRLIRANGLGSGATSRDPARVESQNHGDAAVQWKVRVIDEPSTKNAYVAYSILLQSREVLIVSNYTLSSFVLPNGAIFVFVSPSTG